MKRTLHEQIAANKRSSLFLGFLLVVLLAALGASIAGVYAPRVWWAGGAIAAGVGLIATLVAWTSGPDILLSISGARPANRDEDRILDNVCEEMAIAAGIPKPKLYVIEDSAPNAFATGKDPQHGVICFTTGLIEKLDRDELQGVMAHEMSHIRNYDIKFMTVIAITAGLIPLIADMFGRSMWYGGGRRSSRDNDNSNAIFLVLAIVLAILAPIFAKLLELAVSRQREYLADSSAAELTRYPEGLARALEKISADPDPLEAANRATQHMYIVNPLRGAERMAAMFSTHPPIRERIGRLRALMGNYSQSELPKQDAPR
ncbi:MAG: M48 family metallopeptidase [Fimbriimonadaceae bacterium]|nr:M48 family metallopeptidase [Fimbriimonadaceae bacterium]